MQLKIYSDYQTLSSHVASKIIDTVKANPRAVLCLASGHTPILTYSMLAEQVATGNVDFSHCRFIGLDEWQGIPPGNEGSCHFFLQKNIFGPLRMSVSQAHLFDSLSENPREECNKMNQAISDSGGIDLMLLGVGMNGHLGFNEPGVSFDNYAHVIELDDTTRSVGQKYFSERASIHTGFTLGLKQVMEAREVILMADGTKKAEVIKKTLEGEISNIVPASIVRKHPNSFVMIDHEAASLLQPAGV